MEGFLEGLGVVALVLLIVVGALAGWIAGRVSGRHTLAYIALGIVGALATPFILAALGIGVIAAGGLLLLLVVALVGALIVLAIGRAIMK